MIPEIEKRFNHYFMNYIDTAESLNDTRVGDHKACDFIVDSDLNFS